MEIIQLLSAELSDHSYQFLKLVVYASVSTATISDVCMMEYKLGDQDYKIEGSEIKKEDNRKIFKFSALIKKNSGLAAIGMAFNFSISGKYKTKEYTIGGEYGTILMEGAIIKYHHIYLHNLTIFASTFIKSSNQPKSVKFIFFNDVHTIVKEAFFKEKVPYSEVELWECNVETTNEQIRKLSFYMELQENNRQEKDDNWGNYYTLHFHE